MPSRIAAEVRHRLDFALEMQLWGPPDDDPVALKGRRVDNFEGDGELTLLCEGAAGAAYFARESQTRASRV